MAFTAGHSSLLRQLWGAGPWPDGMSPGSDAQPRGEGAGKRPCRKTRAKPGCPATQSPQGHGPHTEPRLGGRPKPPGLSPWKQAIPGPLKSGSPPSEGCVILQPQHTQRGPPLRTAGIACKGSASQHPLCTHWTNEPSVLFSLASRGPLSATAFSSPLYCPEGP